MKKLSSIIQINDVPIAEILKNYSTGISFVYDIQKELKVLNKEKEGIQDEVLEARRYLIKICWLRTVYLINVMKSWTDSLEEESFSLTKIIYKIYWDQMCCKSFKLSKELLNKMDEHTTFQLCELDRNLKSHIEEYARKYYGLRRKKESAIESNQSVKLENFKELNFDADKNLKLSDSVEIKNLMLRFNEIVKDSCENLVSASNDKSKLKKNKKLCFLIFCLRFFESKEWKIASIPQKVKNNITLEPVDLESMKKMFKLVLNRKEDYFLSKSREYLEKQKKPQGKMKHEIK